MISGSRKVVGKTYSERLDFVVVWSRLGVGGRSQGREWEVVQVDCFCRVSKMSVVGYLYVPGSSQPPSTIANAISTPTHLIISCRFASARTGCVCGQSLPISPLPLRTP